MSSAVLQKKISESKDIPIDEKFDYKKGKTNQYNLPKLEYYKPNTFNQPDNLPAAFHIQDNGGHEC